MNRRSFLKSILATGVAPYVVTTAGVLMPVKKLWVPPETTILAMDLGHGFAVGDLLRAEFNGLTEILRVVSWDERRIEVVRAEVYHQKQNKMNNFEKIALPYP